MNILLPLILISSSIVVRAQDSLRTEYVFRQEMVKLKTINTFRSSDHEFSGNGRLKWESKGRYRSNVFVWDSMPTEWRFQDDQPTMLFRDGKLLAEVSKGVVRINGHHYRFRRISKILYAIDLDNVEALRIRIVNGSTIQLTKKQQPLENDELLQFITCSYFQELLFDYDIKGYTREQFRELRWLQLMYGTETGQWKL